MEHVPMVPFGEEFWRHAIDLDYLAEQGTISPGDQDMGTELYPKPPTTREAVISRFYEL